MLEEHKSGKVQLYPVKEILKNYEPAPDADEHLSVEQRWEKWLGEAKEDVTVQRLREELRASENMLFENPIILVHYPEETSEDGEYYAESYALADGMHRLGAYYLENCENALVQRGYSERKFDPGGVPDAFWIEAKALATPGEGEDWDIPLWDSIFNMLSFRVNGERNLPWLRVGIGAMGGDFREVISITFESSSDKDALRDNFEVISEDLRERLIALGLTPVAVELRGFAQEGEEALADDFGEVCHRVIVF